MSAADSPPGSNPSVTRDVMVPMRDGVRLATDIYRPADAGDETLPILFYRTPYDKDETARLYGFASFLAAHGYTVIAQDCRGCFKSEGDVDFLRPEATDGFDTLQWIAAQPWGDADVGSWGTSWSGWTQTAMAALGPTRLKTIVPNMSGSDGWTSSIRHSGALELRWIAWAFWHAAENTQRALAKDEAMEAALIRPAKRFSDWLRDWPIKRGETQLALTPAYERWALEVMAEADRSAFWDHPSYAPALHQRAAPDQSALIMGSWYDSYTRGTFEAWQARRESGAGRVQLMVGPWLHGTQTLEAASAGGIAFPADAAIADYKRFLLAWFDRELKGQGAGPTGAAPLRLFVMGGGSGKINAAGQVEHGGVWRDEQDWPLVRTDFQRFYLQPDGVLSRTPPTLSEASFTYRYDPADPVPTIGGSISSMNDTVADPPPPAAYHAAIPKERKTAIVAPGGFDQRVTAATFRLDPRTGPLAARADVLVFESAPLAAPVEVTGPIQAHLWVRTDAADTDITAKLIDVYPPSPDLPDGFALNLTDSIQRLSYRDGATKAGPVPRGEIIPVSITLYPTSNVFAAGHRIRVDISSSNFPRFDPNPHAAVNTVFCDAAHPSHIVLPVIPS
ncbi:Cocaine esterase [Alphaproteobacteria bacterium SO-S41]|nr:Cocaine esterase [Alphaproteobacteria bacterium SO-S41]